MHTTCWHLLIYSFAKGIQFKFFMGPHSGYTFHKMFLFDPFDALRNGSFGVHRERHALVKICFPHQTSLSFWDTTVVFYGLVWKTQCPWQLPDILVFIMIHYKFWNYLSLTRTSVYISECMFIASRSTIQTYPSVTYWRLRSCAQTWTTFRVFHIVWMNTTY